MTVGMQAFFSGLAQTLASHGADPFPVEWMSPYTNVLLYNMRLLRADARLHAVFKQVPPPATKLTKLVLY